MSPPIARVLMCHFLAGVSRPAVFLTGGCFTLKKEVFALLVTSLHLDYGTLH